MARQKHTLVKRCTHDGCGETERYVYSSREEYMDAAKRYLEEKWHCTRHDPSGNNLSGFGEKTITEEYTSQESRFSSLSGIPFWNGVNGYAFGSCWNAYAKDFLMGTKITITTKIAVSPPDNTEASNE